jgi:hypothetical protein
MDSDLSPAEEKVRAAFVRMANGLPDVASTVEATGIEFEVCKDIARRQQLGIAKYGTTVANNPLELRAWLQHSLEETLDNAIYLKRAISEIDRKAKASEDESCWLAEAPDGGYYLRETPRRTGKLGEVEELGTYSSFEARRFPTFLDCLTYCTENPVPYWTPRAHIFTNPNK